MLLEGLHLPVTTPFYPDERLNLVKLQHNIERYSKTPAAGLMVLGDTGEPLMLSDEETQQVLRSAIEAAAPEKVMLAGVSRNSVAVTLEMAETAARLGYDAVLVKAPSILLTNGHAAKTKEILTYFHSVADRSPLPMILVSGPAEDARMLAAELVIELAKTTNIIGVMDSGAGEAWIQKIGAGTGEVRRQATVTTIFRAVTARMRMGEKASESELISAGMLTGGGTALTAEMPKAATKTRSRTLGFQILAGTTAGMLEALRAGAVGAVPAFAASAPQACYEVMAAWKDGDEGLAREKQERLQDVAKRVEGELGVAGVKYGCDLNGYFGGRTRSPLLPLTGREREEVEDLMHGIRN
jgi:4-hydroxy-2-oxoglutarate aldolase